MNGLPTRDELLAAARGLCGGLIEAGRDHDGALLAIIGKIDDGDFTSWTFAEVSNISGVPLQIIVMQFEQHVLAVSGKRIQTERMH